MNSGWTRYTLEDVIEVASGLVDPNAPPYSELPHVGGDNIESHTGKLRNLRRSKDLGLISGKYSFGKEHVLYSKIRPNLNKVVVSEFEGICSADIYPLKPKNGLISREFLAHLLRSDEFVGYAISHSTRTNIPKINRKALLEYSLSLPVLKEQNRIAAILDKADAIRRKLQQSLRFSDDFLRSVFLDMFGDPVANPKGWPIVTIRDLLVTTAYGTSKKASEAEGQFPCLRMNNITYSGGWNFTSLKYVDLDKNEQSKNLVHAGQLLFNRTNSKELVGKTAVYRRKEPMAFAGYLVRGIANDESDTEYISAFLNLPHGKAILQGMCKNIIGMANINAEEFKSIRIAKPPVTLQKRFAKIVISTEQKKETLQKFLTEAETLFSSLQQRAFRGEL